VGPRGEERALRLNLALCPSDPVCLLLEQVRDRISVKPGGDHNLEAAADREPQVDVFRAAALAHDVARQGAKFDAHTRNCVDRADAPQ
jgi:hypothetical protein